MKLKEKIGFKIAAVILSYIAVLTLVLSVVATGVMGYYKFYFSSEELIKEEILTDMAESEAYYIETLMWRETNLKTYYRNKNVYYRLTDLSKGVVEDTNYNGEDYFVTGSSEHVEYEEYSFIDEYGNERWSDREIGRTKIEVFVAKNMNKNDLFSVTLKIIEIGYSLRFAMVFIVLISLALSITLLCYLYCAAGHRQGGAIECNAIDKIPFDILTVLVGLAVFFSIFPVDSLSYNRIAEVLWIFIIGTVDYFVALMYTMSFATRVKTKTLIKNTAIYWIFKYIGKYLKRFCKFIKYIYKNLPTVYKTIALIGALLVLEVLVIIVLFNIYWVFDIGAFIIAVVFLNVAVITAMIYASVTFQRIKIGGEKIASGDLEHKIDTEYMFGDFKEFAESLNNINDGLQTAVDEKMKSEHFKTELITNVSHDIKTPLTSIINYVDLIKKEDIENKNLINYIEVLDRQSSRLKKLVEDLVEASKASTGNLNVNLSECDVGVLTTQILGEFEEKLAKAELTPVFNIPQTKVKIMADGRHLWRVFDNLMNNICKYALERTRVYIDVTNKGNKAVITFRNISKYALNVSADELMERFVRGDASRNTEGSGLGLSIAKSLVELQGGKFELSVDGDLFKAIIIFETVN